MTVYGDYETPDNTEVSDRQPAFCPYCGQNGSFDGQGGYSKGYLHRCGDCGLQFATFLPEDDV
jgi:tRNA(Ile2) C34 agmatinyltransferase TiaS